MRSHRLVALLLCSLTLGHGTAELQGKVVTFSIRSARSGRWSDANTWEGNRTPRAGDSVQIRPAHRVTYDVVSDAPIRIVHVAGRLTFARDRSTRLDVGLLKVQPGEAITEDGFQCDAHTQPARSNANAPVPALEIGTAANPVPSHVTATIRLIYFDGADRETTPAIIVCDGRWDVHGAPLSQTWVKLGATAKPGDATATLHDPVRGWKAGDRLLITASREAAHTGTFRAGVRGGQAGNTEERVLIRTEGTALVLDRPLNQEHFGTGAYRSEVANLSRNVVIESATPEGVRGHTMYHKGSSGGISYAEFRHLGKEGVLGKYPIHFHLIGGLMRGSSVVGVSVWDSHNRWITIHGTDYLLVRDCVGYQSVGHGFFLEDGTEQHNILDHNLAVQAFRGKKLPRQVLGFDENEGAGFWWANGRNTFTRNVACENDAYGFRYEIARRSNFEPTLTLRLEDGRTEVRDVRTLPFYRFDSNESHSEGLYSFNFGDDVNPSVRGDRQHPFIARNLLAWETHYALRPNLQFFLMDGLNVRRGAYGVYHPDYDSHVYRNIYLNNVDSEPINRGHDDDSIQYGNFTYDNVVLENCVVGRDPLIQLTCTSPLPGRTGHFRNLTIKNSRSRQANIVDLGGGPRNDSLEQGVVYYFHDFLTPGKTTRVVSVKFPDLMHDGNYRSVEGFTDKDVRAAEVAGVAFPTLLEPVDDLAPVTLITSVLREGARLRIRGTTADNGEIAWIKVNGRPVTRLTSAAGVADWEIALPVPPDGLVTARAADRAGNIEKQGHVTILGSVMEAARTKRPHPGSLSRAERGTRAR